MGYFDVFLVVSMLFGLGAAQQMSLFTPVVAGIGYVQVQAPNGNVGFICDDSWNQAAAIVFCTNNGYQATGIAEPGARSEFLPALPPNPVIALDDVNCDGDENVLTECIQGFTANSWFVSNCIGNGLAAVTCVNVPDPTPDGPAPDLQCNSANMVLEYLPPWDVVADPVMTLLFTPPLNQLTIPYNDINTAVAQIANTIVYTRVVDMTYPAYPNSNDLFLRYEATLTCTLPQVGQIEATFQATGVVALADQGAFDLEMNIYQDRTFVNEVVNYPYQLPMGDWMNMAVVLNTQDNRLRLVVTECLAAPVPNIPIGQNNVFYNDDRCLVQPSMSATYPINNNMFGFRIQSFAFLAAPQVVLQCDVIVCLVTDETQQCDRSCNPNPVGRRRRDTLETSNANRTVYKVYSRLISISNVTSTDEESLTVSTPTQKSTNIRVENEAMNPNQPSRLVMTLGNAASLPSVSVIHVFVPVVAVLYLCLLYTE